MFLLPIRLHITSWWLSSCASCSILSVCSTTSHFTSISFLSRISFTPIATWRLHVPYFLQPFFLLILWRFPCLSSWSHSILCLSPLCFCLSVSPFNLLSTRTIHLISTSSPSISNCCGHTFRSLWCTCIATACSATENFWGIECILLSAVSRELHKSENICGSDGSQYIGRSAQIIGWQVLLFAKHPQLARLPFWGTLSSWPKSATYNAKLWSEV